ncbi:hypothetical protein ACJJI4_14360 [Microbulbifer sp. TRSA002]|uniref:hypothetical protein n=1 Tax=Microbulbifer sp. TRSA002 TaxID=3243382 RepID=UPI004039F92A
MHILTLYQSILRWFLLMTVAVSLTACGGGGSAGGDDDDGGGGGGGGGGGEATYSIDVELQDLETGEVVQTPNPEEPVRVQVTIKLDGDPVASSNILVTTTLGELVPGSGVVTTDDSGVASLELDLEGEEVGNAGEIIVAYDDISTDQDPYSPLVFTVGEPSLQLGYLDGNQQFVPGELEITAQDLSSRGTTPISVYVQGPDGDLYAKRMQVEFSSNCSLSEPAVATLDSPVTTTEGKATSTYTALGCVGEDSISAVLSDYPSISATGQLTVMPPEIGSIEFVSAEPEIINIQGSGGKETSEVRFQVFSKDDLPMSGVEVGFTLEDGDGNVSLASNSGTTDAEGEVIALVSAGSVSLPIRVKATVTDENGTSYSTVSSDLVVSAGILDQDSFSLSASVLRVNGDAYDGVKSEITIRVGDDDNTIPDGTAISFKTEYGRIAGYCTTEGGDCSVDWNSQNPRAPLEYKFLGDDGEMHSLRTINNTKCPVTGLMGYPCPQPLGQPYGGRSTILAYALGQESFTDANSNGQYDTGETFVDLPEAFLDHNEDGAFGNSKSSGSCYPGCPEEAGDEEVFIPLNDNGKYDSGNGIYNGLSCSEAAEADGACSKELVHVREELVILVAGEAPHGIFQTLDGNYTTRPEVEIALGGATHFDFYLSDKYNGHLPEGTTVKTISENCQVSYGSAEIPFGPELVAFTITAPSDADYGSEYVTVEVNVPAPGGDSGSGVTKAWQIKCTVK